MLSDGVDAINGAATGVYLFSSAQDLFEDFDGDRVFFGKGGYAGVNLFSGGLKPVECQDMLDFTKNSLSIEDGRRKFFFSEVERAMAEILFA